jgi:hypothetical protein
MIGATCLQNADNGNGLAGRQPFGSQVTFSSCGVQKITHVKVHGVSRINGQCLTISASSDASHDNNETGQLTCPKGSLSGQGGPVPKS